MVEYRVETNYMRKKDKPRKTKSIVTARRMAMEMMLDNNGRFVYGEIYIGDSTRPKYIIQTWGMYSRPRDAIQNGAHFVQATVGAGPNGSWGNSKRLNMDGTIPRK